MKILIVDDHPLFVEGVRPALEKLSATVELLSARSSQEARELMDSHDDLKLILLDLSLPDEDGLSLLRSSRAFLDKAPVVLLTASRRLSDMQAALAAGAKGYICKSSTLEVVRSALSLVIAGGVYIPPEMIQDATGEFQQLEETTNAAAVTRATIRLTPRQTEVLKLLVDGQGRSNKEIANLIGCSEATIKVHVTALLKAMDVSNRVQLQTAARQLGLQGVERRQPDQQGDIKA